MEKGKVNVLYTSATEGEVLQHIREDIGEAVRAYNRALKKEAVFLLEHDNFGISKIDAEKAIVSVESKFMEFLNLDSVHIISLNPIDAEKLMADYFIQNPPFESKKPYEFKDTFPYLYGSYTFIGDGFATELVLPIHGLPCKNRPFRVECF